MLVVGCSSADATDQHQAVAEYEASLAPLKKRSDVLEERFASVQAEGYTGPERVRDVLEEIIPEYARLLEKTRAIEVDGEGLARAHALLVDSLERQQDGLETALRALDEDDSALMAEAGAALEEAQGLVERHRSLLARARRLG